MSEPAKKLPQSPQPETSEFGIEKLLVLGGKAFFEKIFSTRHMGRIVDLLLFEARDFVVKASSPVQFEHRIRVIYELAVFAAWAVYRRDLKERVVEVEAGWDGSKLVVGISTFLDANVQGFVPGKDEPSSAPGKALSDWIRQLQGLSDGVMLRHHPSTGFLQLIAMIEPDPKGPRKDSVEYTGLSELPSQVELPATVPPETAPKPLALARVNDFLLEEKNEGPDSVPAPAESLEGKKGPLGTVEPNAEEKFKAEREKEEKTTIAAAKEEQEKHKVKVGDRIQTDQVTRVSGGEKEIEEAADTILGKIHTELGNSIKELPEDKLDSSMGEISSSIKENIARTVDHLTKLKDISTASKLAEYKAKIDALTLELDTIKKTTPEGKAAAAAATAGVDEAKVDMEKDPMGEIHKEDRQFNEMMSKYKGNVDMDKVPPSAKDWAKGFMEETLRERAKLNEKVREVESYLKKKQLDFKNQLTSFQEKLRIKEEEMKQKDFTLKKTKESLSKAIAQIEKRKKDDLPNSDSSTLSRKLQSTEALLSSSKESTERISQKLNEVQQRWVAESSARSQVEQELSKSKRQIEDLQRQIDSAKAEGPSKPAATASFDREREAHQKTVENLKAQIKTLQTKLTQASSTNRAAGLNATASEKHEADANQMKFKLDHANKLMKVMKDEMERQKQRFDQLRQSETKLKLEVSKLQAQLKTAGKPPPIGKK